jgi:hypothetical protein
LVAFSKPLLDVTDEQRARHFLKPFCFGAQGLYC